MSYQNPKDGDSFGNEELLTHGQMNVIMDNQRHMIANQWTHFATYAHGMAGGTVMDVHLVPYGSDGSGYEGAGMCWAANAVGGDVAFSQSFVPDLSSLTELNGKAPASAAGDSNVVIFAHDTGANSAYEKYNHIVTGDTTTLGRAGAVTTGSCNSMVYDSKNGEYIAAWDDGVLERSIGGGSFGTSTYGGSEVVYLEAGDGDIVGLLAGSSSNIAFSADGLHTSFSTVALGVTFTFTPTANGTVPRNCSYDPVTGKWYIVDRSMTNGLRILTSTSPGTSWNLIPNVDDPISDAADETTHDVNGIVVNSDIIMLLTSAGLMLSTDLGQSWRALGQPNAGLSKFQVLKRTGGRLVLADSTNLYVWPQMFEPFPTAFV